MYVWPAKSVDWTIEPSLKIAFAEALLCTQFYLILECCASTSELSSGNKGVYFCSQSQSSELSKTSFALSFVNYLLLNLHRPGTGVQKQKEVVQLCRIIKFNRRCPECICIWTRLKPPSVQQWQKTALVSYNTFWIAIFLLKVIPLLNFDLSF